jgi:hypothetical protein
MAAAKTLVDAEGFDELERRRDGTFAPGTSGNQVEKRRDPLRCRSRSSRRG